MIERSIPRDIKNYESKLIGTFTTRQVLCGIPGLGLGVGAYFLTKGFVGDLAFLIAIVIAGPFMLCGWWKPYGVPFEKFAKIVIMNSIIAPTIRRYKTENTYNTWFSEPKIPQKKKQYKSKAKDCQSV